MAIPRKKLQRPPVVEALVDIKAKTDVSEETLRNLGADLKTDFPRLKVLRNVQSKVDVKDGKLVPPATMPILFSGVQLLSEDNTRIAQFRPDGFTFNSLRPYGGGDELLSTALRLWNRFREAATPGAVTRIAVRYINRLELPLVEGANIDTYLTTAPKVPDHLPAVGQFLVQVFAQNPGEPGYVVLTQRLFMEDSKPVALLDIDTVLEGEEVIEKVSLADALTSLRARANRSFFSLITDETVKLYD
jgi:uncharacterized protein (TIGR04255 family)